MLGRPVLDVLKREEEKDGKRLFGIVDQSLIASERTLLSRENILESFYEKEVSLIESIEILEARENPFYPKISDDKLKKEVPKRAFEQYKKLGEFFYDQPEFEASLGLCEDRPL